VTALVAISTATSSGAVAVGRDDGVRATATLRMPHSHAEFVAAALRTCADAAAVGMPDVDAVAVDVGPGMFTGVRVGIATAKGVATALGVPMLPLSSLELLAYALRWHVGTVAAVLDARRSEVFVRTFRCDGAGDPVPVDDARAVAPERFVVELAESGGDAGDVLCVGTGTEVYASLFDAAGLRRADAAYAHPGADAALDLAFTRFAADAEVPPFDVVPVYLRRSDAELVADARAGEPS
jgi:tRNA threonylcarbamoyladenosine biosynthesis protein TsaB